MALEALSPAEARHHNDYAFEILAEQLRQEREEREKHNPEHVIENVHWVHHGRDVSHKTLIRTGNAVLTTWALLNFAGMLVTVYRTGGLRELIALTVEFILFAVTLVVFGFWVSRDREFVSVTGLRRTCKRCIRRIRNSKGGCP